MKIFKLPTLQQVNQPAHSEETLPHNQYQSSGEIRSITDFMAPRNSHTLLAKVECAYKWLLAKDLSRDKVPFTDVDNWNPKLVDLKKKGFPRYPYVQQAVGVAILVFLTPKFSLWSKTKRQLLRLPDRISPYYLLPEMEMQWIPIYKIKWRYGFDIHVTSVNMNRLHEGDVEFCIDHAGKTEIYRFGYQITGRLQDPFRFYYYCSNTQNAQDRFRQEAELILRGKIENAYKEKYNSVVSSLSGTIDLQKFGYGANTKFELFYKSNQHNYVLS